MIEIPITSACDFFKMANSIKKERNHPSEIEFYRGHSNKEWRLLPSIHRRYMLGFEENLINEFMRRRPDEFSESDGIFNALAKMQHYGLHTRLLDVTENPAVALFFTCSDDLDKDGEVFTFQCSLDDIPSNTVLNIITEFYVRHTNSGGNYDVVAYYEYAVNNFKAKDVDMAFYHICNGYYCISRPKIISERILRQLGSFLLFANEVCPKSNCDNQKCIHRDTDRCRKDNIAQDFRERVKDLKVKSHCLYDFTDRHIEYEQHGYRYIIKAENKKDILSELQTIGINKAFLFPELNNEGMDIMEDYYSRVE